MPVANCPTKHAYRSSRRSTLCIGRAGMSRSCTRKYTLAPLGKNFSFKVRTRIRCLVCPLPPSMLPSQYLLFFFRKKVSKSFSDHAPFH